MKLAQVNFAEVSTIGEAGGSGEVGVGSILGVCYVREQQLGWGLVGEEICVGGRRVGKGGSVPLALILR